MDPNQLSEPEQRVLRNLQFDNACSIYDLSDKTGFSWKEPTPNVSEPFLEDILHSLQEYGLVIMVSDGKYRLSRNKRTQELVMAISI